MVALHRISTKGFIAATRDLEITRRISDSVYHVRYELLSETDVALGCI